jgi:hypothetical protein
MFGFNGARCWHLHGEAGEPLDYKRPFGRDRYPVWARNSGGDLLFISTFIFRPKASSSSNGPSRFV